MHHSKKSRRKRLFRLFIVLIFSYLCYLWVFSKESILRYHSLKNKNSQIRMEIDSLFVLRDSLLHNKTLLQSDSHYIERVIREKLLMFKKGERVFRFLDYGDELKIEEIKK